MFGLVRRLLSITVKLAVVAGGVGVITGYANLSDVDGWAEDLQDQVFRVSGQRLHIDGPVDFTMTMPSRIVLEGVRLQNVKGGKARDMLRAKSLVAEVDMLPLVVGDVAVPRVRLVEPEIMVEIDRRGRSNWEALTRLEPASTGTPPVGGFNLPTVLSSGNLTLSGGTVTVSNAGAGTTTSFSLPSTSLDIGAGLHCL